MLLNVKKSGGKGMLELQKRLEELRQSEVLVGIPAANAPRQGQAINNASLLYVMTHGSALKHIPPRPVIEPAIALNKKLITPHLAAAAKAMITEPMSKGGEAKVSGNPQLAERELNLAGTVAVNSIKRFFTDSRNNWAPNAPSTIKKKGSSRPLIDTGAFRRAFTYIIRRKAGSTPAKMGTAKKILGTAAEVIEGITEL